ncbi:MAG TPA: YitT family protein [Clostridia bacterium]|nr:YitT family protein [Clostridia bacterium]
MKNIIRISIFLFLGAFIGAYSFNNVLLPSSLISGGLGGIATVITRWYAINIQLVLAVLCLPVLIWAYVTFGFKQIIYAFTCFALFTVLLGIVKVFPVLNVDVILAALLSGVLFGISGGIVLRLGVANGPEALVGIYLKNKYGISLGIFFTVVNIIIVSSSLLLPDATLNSILYSMVSIYISGKVTDFIVAGFRRDYEVTIISEKYSEITAFIHKDLKRGATFIKGLGSYNQQEKMLIKTLVSNSELIALKEYVKKVDPLCFMYINESIGVVGEGFEKIMPV